jgi:NADH dehydrogenase
MKRKKRVVIVGMGFGGMEAARHLADSGLEVLILDRHNYHLFQPLLYQVATAELNVEAIAYPIRDMIRHWKNVGFRLAEVTGVDFDKREVLITSEEGDDRIAYDYLVLAAGSVTNFFNNAEIVGHSYDLKQLNDAIDLRNQILSAYERAALETDEAKRRALMTFVVVGGGPTGVEFSGALSELAHNVLKKDFHTLNVDDTRIVLVESSDEILSMFAPKLRDYALERLKRMRVEVLLGKRVSGATADKVLLEGGEEIPAHTLFWAAGVRAAPLADAIPVPKARGGRVPVEPDLSLKEHPEVFVIGDLMHLEQDGKPLPMVAPVAMQGGKYAARAILAREKNQKIAPFRYWDKGSMAVIGRGTAVAMTGKLKLKGFLAWVAWLILHLYYLIGFRNRVMALLSWAHDYVFYDRQVRLITKLGPKRED